MWRPLQRCPAVDCSFRLENVIVPEDLTFAINLMAAACESRLAADGLRPESDSIERLQQLPTEWSKLNEEWKFHCTYKSTCTSFNYVDKSLLPGFQYYTGWRYAATWEKAVRPDELPPIDGLTQPSRLFISESITKQR